ncbi:DUF4974 domain-containing protein [Chitinophaga sp. Mgbs1]|uniref:DUF4974 domain-containing protein n=1 Tax=Chitinophaga solisilvae TaxID=1233460 RepID=A0A433WK66_9BACT|nr:DUF4974 domain-containing protein [Chitinophaga solisilvae]
MHITQLKKIIDRYLAGNASDKEAALMEEWCQRAWEETQQTPVNPQAETKRLAVLDNLRLIIQEQPEENTIAGKIIWFTKARTIAAACLVLLMGTALGYRYQYSLLDIIDPIPLQKVTALRFQVRQVILPDSSVVILNEGSEISYPRRFRGNKREVRLNGEAFFSVTRNPAAAFTITAPHLQVQVLGTSFMMTDSAGIPAARVSVKTGKVAVTSDAKGFPATQLSARQELAWDEASGIIRINRHQDVNIEWTSKQLIFNNAVLADVFREIEKKFGVNITATPEIMSTAFTGAFDAGDSLSGILHVISLSYRCSIHTNKDGTIMIR